MAAENVAVVGLRLAHVGRDGRTRRIGAYTLFRSDRWRIATVLIADPDRLLHCDVQNRRDRDFAFLDQGRIRAIVGLAAIVLIGSLVFVSVDLGRYSLESATRVAALASLVCCLPLYFWVVVPAVREFRRPESQAQPWVIRLSTLLVGIATLLYALVVIDPARLWVLGGGYSLQIAHALWMFLRLLTGPRPQSPTQSGGSDG